MLPFPSSLSLPLPLFTASGTEMSSFQLGLLQSCKVLPPSSKGSSLKVVILGSKGVGKTAFVRRFVSEELGISIDDVTPTASSFVCSPSSPLSKPLEMITISGRQSPEVGLDIYELELPLMEQESDSSGKSLVENSDNGEGESSHGNILRLSIWDFSGNEGSLRSVQKVFFAPQTLYVVLWDMAVKDVLPVGCKDATVRTIAAQYLHTSLTNNYPETIINSNLNGSLSYQSASSSTFRLGYDSDSDDSDYDYYDDCDVDLYSQEEIRKIKRKLERDIDKKVQCWIDHIQKISPGATILPMATHIDRLSTRHRPDLRGGNTSSKHATKTNSDEFQEKEVKKRCWLLKERLVSNEAKRVKCLHDRISHACNSDESNSVIEHLSRPNLCFGNVQKDGQSLPHAMVACFKREHEPDDGSIRSTLSESETASANAYEESFLMARNFVRFTAFTITAGDQKRTSREQFLCGRDSVTLPPSYLIATGEPSVSTSLASVMLRDVRQKLWHRSKILQTNYFTEKFESSQHDHDNSSDYYEAYQDRQSSNNNGAVLKALESLHRNGELCFFGGLISYPERQCKEQMLDISLLSDFVVLDPTWLVESIDFILQLAKTSNENNKNSRTMMRVLDKPNRHRFTNCSTIDKDEVRRLWKNRHSTKQGLGLAENYHQFQNFHDDGDRDDRVADRVFEYILCLLKWHDVVIPLFFQPSEPQHFFLPSLMPQMKAHISPLRNCHQSNSSVSKSPVLRDVTLSSALSLANEESSESLIDLRSSSLQDVCHGFIFVDMAPETLMERIFVHINKSISDILSKNCKPIHLEEIYFWKDFFRLRLCVDGSDKKEEKYAEIYSVLLEAPGCGTSPHIANCKSMLVTFLRGSNEFESQTLWRQSYLRIRNAMQNALDETLEIEYTEEGICPKCLNKKPIGDAGTWKLSKLQSVLLNNETFVRCRHGHLTELILDGFLQCQLKKISKERHAEIDSMRKRFLTKTDTKILPHARQEWSPRTLMSAKRSQLSRVTSGTKEARIISPSANMIRRLNFRASQSKPSLTYTRNKSGTFSRHPINNKRVIKQVTFDDGVWSVSRTMISDVSPEQVPNEAKEKMTRGNYSSRVSKSKVSALFDMCKTKTKQLFDKKNHLDLENRNMTEADLPMEGINGTEFGLRLQSISLSYNKLESLPENLVRCLTNLRFMNVSHCLIYELPKKWNLPLLKRLDISHNLLIRFPEESVLLGLLQLEELNLSGNKIRKVVISENPQVLRKLRRLDLSSNELVCYPACLDRVTSLKYLDLQCNNI